MTKRVFVLLLAITALTGLALAAFSTPKGLGLVNDSVAYINGARGLVEGSGYGRLAGDGTIKPITHFPPGFSVVLALFGLVGMDAIPAARIVNLGLFALNIVLVGLLAQRAARSPWAGVLAAALFAFSDALLGVHAYALSEPLFLTFTMGAMLALLRAVELFPPKVYNSGWVMALIVSGDLAGLAYLTRYVGLALLPVGTLALLLVAGSWKQKLQRAAIFLGSALAWIVVWTVRNAALVGSATNRTFGYHAIPAQNVLDGVRNLWAFALPRRIPLVDWLPGGLWVALTGLGLALLAAGLVWGLLRALRGQRESLAAWLVGLHLAAYLVMIVLSMTFVDASTTFEDRILAPVFADAIILLAWGFARAAQRAGSSTRPALIVLAVLLALSFADDARKTALELRVDGQGFASSYWSNSEVMDGVRRLPEVTIYSNRISALTLLADRQAIAMLSPIDPVTREPRPNFERTQSIIRETVLHGRAVLVVFAVEELDGIDWFEALVDGVPVMIDAPEGRIYGRLDE